MISKDEKKFLEETRDDLKRILRRIECTLAVDATSSYDAMEDQSKSEEYIVTQYLMKLGVPTSVTGFGYIKSGVLYLLKEENRRVLVTRELYPKIAEEYNSSVSKVECAIRTAIGKAERRCTKELQIILYDREELRLTNMEFITLVTEKIRLGL